MSKNNVSCLFNKSTKALDPSLVDFADHNSASQVNQFHHSLPNYTPTPLVNLSHLACKLGVKNLLVKDESHRFNLNAFKVLGASYAIAMHLIEILGLEDEQPIFSNIISNKAKYKNTTFVTATDGNHGRAVAWAAQLFGCKAIVYMPSGSSQARLNAIRAFGAEASIINGNYDDTVNYANAKAQKEGWVLLQDTSWEGYKTPPQRIMQGYMTLITEYLEQESEIWPTHVFLQSGVGSFAAAIVATMCTLTDYPTPKFIVVEPQGAPCLYESIKQNNGERIRVDGDLETIMAGLACGEPSLLGWDILKIAASAFLICTDEITCKGMRVLGHPLKGDEEVISGESGAVTMGALYEMLTNKDYYSITDKLDINSDSSILLFSTEGDTDPDMYREIVCNSDT